MQSIPNTPEHRLSPYIIPIGTDSEGFPVYWDAGWVPNLTVTGEDDACNRMLSRIMLQAASAGWRLATLNGWDHEEATHVLDDVLKTFEFRQRAVEKADPRFSYRPRLNPILLLVDNVEYLLATGPGSGYLRRTLTRIVRAGGSVNIHVITQLREDDDLAWELFKDKRLTYRLDLDDYPGDGEKHPACTSEKREDDEPGLPLFPPIPDLNGDVRNLFDYFDSPSDWDESDEDETGDEPCDSQCEDDETDESDDYDDTDETDDIDSETQYEDTTHRLRIGIDENNQTIHWNTLQDRHLWVRGVYETATTSNICSYAQAKGWMTVRFNLVTDDDQQELQVLHHTEQALDYLRRTFNDATPLPLLVTVEGLPEVQARLDRTPENIKASLLVARIAQHLRALIENTENDVHLLLSSHKTGNPYSFASLTLEDTQGHADYLSPSSGKHTEITVL
ncbi:hypothetical protein [Bifidobacterium callitrichidarum]|uniref:Uncharacterized protein n=1 Tax=Bifidobacterium callitrichidarum TaxID=2052941 RepID=A0A2U2N9D6_9BIFI|nr:hypothetical protein [Bifidobacterium callitrichidarum]PWG65687.1 hypothetical protein DF196_07065 [Bifidobacterium callitrichidarum]